MEEGTIVDANEQVNEQANGNGWKEVKEQIEALAKETPRNGNRREIESRLLTLATHARVLAVKDAIYALAAPSATDAVMRRAFCAIRLAGVKTRGMTVEELSQQVTTTTGQRVPRGGNR